MCQDSVINCIENGWEELNELRLCFISESNDVRDVGGCIRLNQGRKL